jgi:ferric-dicitrate binding protein FerR (iron transport regulator)
MGKHFKEEIMRIRRRSLTLFGLVMLAGLSAFKPAMARTPIVVGKVVNSTHATVEGSELLSNGTILSGDAVNVGEGGSVLLSFSPTGRATLAAATNVRFSNAKGSIEATLLAGTLAVQKEKKDAFVVKMSTYKVEPQGEGKSEFMVALLPDKSTLIRAQHGNVAITETVSGERVMLPEGLLAEIPAAAGVPGQTEEPGNAIGKVVASAGATRNGKPLANGDSVMDDDVVATAAAGRAVIELSPTNHITLNENTTGRFSRIVERVWLRLQSGTVVAENKGEEFVFVATPKFHIEPNTAGASKIYVGVMTDDSTYIESVAGDVKIQEIQSGQSFLLPAGQNTMVPADASGLPGLKPLEAANTPAPPETPPPSTPPSNAPGNPPSTPPSNPQTASKPKPHSHTTIIILGVAAGVGVGAAAALAGGGHGGGTSCSQSVSPSCTP